MDRKLLEQFQQPTPAFQGKPFWSWNGRLEKEELLRQIHMFKEMGFGGFFMHSRTGLQTEYLGEEWFELINACAEEAEKLGMEAWLYDEDRWPSGTAGGLVTEEPKYRLKYIRLQVVPASEFQWNAEAIAAFVCKVEGLAYTDCRKLDSAEEWQRAAEDAKANALSILLFTIEEQEKESFYNGYTYLDTMNREAVDRFLELTHEKYKINSQQHFGRAIQGIFTDEPHRGALMDGFGGKNRDAHWLAPWTYTLFDKFNEKYGYELVPHLPELFLQPEGRSVSQVKWHYTDLLQDMFHDNFAIPIQEWCREHNLKLTGHVLHEDSLSAQSAMIGSVMRYYEHMDYPGVDVLSEGNMNFWIVKQLSSAARQLGKTWLLSELYGCTGWQMPLEGHKAVGDWQALFGINVRCHHLSWYSMEGEAKRDYPASIFRQSGWWREYEGLENYFSRLGVILSQGTPVCDLLVLNPVESVWCQIYPGWSRGLGAQSPAIIELERHYQATFHWLSGAQIDFDYGDEEMMSRLSSIERDENGKAVLRVGEAVYRTVLVTGMTTMRATTLHLLEAFREAGGSVIVAGEAPRYIDAVPSDAAEQLARQAAHVPFVQGELVQSVTSEIELPVTVRDAQTGEAIGDIFIQVRRDGDSLYAVIMNMNRTQWHRNVEIAIRQSATVTAIEEWFCATGDRMNVPYASIDGMPAFVTDFPPTGEHVYVIRTAASTESEAKALPSLIRYEDAKSAEVTGSYAFRLNEPNVYMLDRAAYRIDGGSWSAPLEILKADRAIRRELELHYRAGDMIQPWYREKFMQETVQQGTPLELRLIITVSELPQGAVYLAVERPERLNIHLNGQHLGAQVNEEEWIDPCFVKLVIPSGVLVEGENQLDVSLEFHPGFDLEAMYLLGNFGVRIDGTTRIIEKLPERLNAGDITKQGLPFYGGTVTYTLEPAQLQQALAAIEGDGSSNVGKAVLAFPDFEAACINVRGGGQTSMMAWQPYEADIAAGEAEFDMVLTRRNTFGPLHQLPLHTPHYGPDNWVTEGSSFSEADVLLPSGLLGAPKLVWKRELPAPPGK
ncbi:glycosyl hydrolase [Paenibacillus spongiae]|uniref:Glycoside hydrolase n=1 Tax=Paenibacillus spongiae TaxID=2909671 RepID=A0ABY5S6S9_9BACL|nr:glycosyl hydrolase [Paenibacillus spongiae]UVI29616.1 hypothetical protein L1F29_30075 [Paenibacillus spongiae]